MSTFAPAITTISPSLMNPEFIMQYSMASGAFEILADGAPKVRLGTMDLVVYQKMLRMTSQAMAGQSLAAQLPSSSVVPFYDQMMTYRIQSRSQYSYLDTDAASQWGYSLVDALRLANRQAHAQYLRNMLLYGVNAANNEGIVNSPNAITINLGKDSKNNETYPSWDSGEMAIFLLNQIASQKTKALVLGQATKTVILAPQRFLQTLEYTGVVQLTTYQRAGAGTATVGTMVKTIANEAHGDEILFAADDTLIGKGAGGSDLIVITIPELVIPKARQDINTNIFATLTPNQQAVNVMFMDVAAPTEVPSPIPDGGLTTLFTCRSTPGWSLRSEVVTLLSAKYTNSTKVAA
ncbi:MAG TPA: hypothetical protein ACHBX6_13145 [Arsenophonus nasoniae]|uniref:hypothetical protein n=1 Tax=Arsenophonus nasoniae TaxID=638 RepID=UPI00387A4272